MMTQTDFVGVYFLIYTFWLVALVCILLNSFLNRVIVSALVTALITSLYQAAPDARGIIGDERRDFAILVIGSLFVVLTFSLALHLPATFHKPRLSLRTRLRRVLVPSQFELEATETSSRDAMKRWFVAVV